MTIIYTLVTLLKHVSLYFTGSVGIVLNLEANIPYSNSTEDLEAAERAYIFDVSIYTLLQPPY